MSVAGMGEHEVINRGISCDEPGEKPCDGALLAQCAAESPHRQHRRGEEKRTAEIPRGNAVSGSGYAVPEIKETLHADHDELPGVGAYPLECQAPAFGFIADFSQALKLFQLQLVEIGLQSGDEHAVSHLVVAQAELQSEIVANEDEAPEDLVVPNQPGRKDEKEHERGKDNAAERRETTAVSLPPDAQAAERQKRQHRRI